MSQDSSERLLHTVLQVARELHPGQPLPTELSLDSSLDLDLAFDSLGRVELLLRLERTFGVSLSEQLLASADTPRDLLRAVLAAQGRETRPSPRPLRAPRMTGSGTGVPDRAETLLEVLHWHLRQHPDRLHIRLYDDQGEGEAISYRQLMDAAQAVAAGLQARDLRPREVVALMLPTGAEYFYSFIGILLAGGIPCPVYPPGRLSQIEEHLQRHVAILDNAAATTLITVAEALPFAAMLRDRLPLLRLRVTATELLGGASTSATLAEVRAEDIVFLQYTSGSTGTPKGVVLSHANLLANIRAMGRAIAVHPGDVFVSWLPLYHDMGLIGAWFGSLYHALPLVIMSPLSFIARPRRWLQAIHRYGGTLSAAPNFGYEHCLRRLGEADLSGLDLSAWRCAFNGAEAVSPATLEQFCQRFAPLGFRRTAMMPVYGLAESTVGLAFPPLQRGPRIDRIDREPLQWRGEALPGTAPSEQQLRVVSCGRVLPGHQLRVVDAQDRELPERRQGRIQFQGPSATSGYYHNPEQTRRLFCGPWLETGDLGYIADGELFVTGRSKDLIIVAGRNLHPAELEQAVGELEAVRNGCVAVFGSRNPASETERLVVLAETNEEDPSRRRLLVRDINRLATMLLGMPADEVRLVAPKTVLKTSSGKVRRAACRALYESGHLDRGPRALWLQLLRIRLSGVAARLQRAWLRIGSHAFAAYGWGLYGLLAALTVPLLLLLPGKALRWQQQRAAVRTLARLTGTPVRLEGAARLPPKDTPCVFVANHASYLDGYLVVGYLPRRVRFVAKGELLRKRALALLLRRMDAEFVERFDSEHGAADAVRLARDARAKAPLFYFAEGTFTRMPGVLPFQLGAFITAVEQDLPVVPLGIRGTRSMLRAGSWFPRPGHLIITIGQPIPPPPSQPGRESDNWHRAIALREQTRNAVLQLCGEADLSEVRVRPPAPER